MAKKVERVEWIFFSFSHSHFYLTHSLFGFSLSTNFLSARRVCSLGNYWEQEKQRKNISYIIRFISSYYQLRLITAVAIVFDFSLSLSIVDSFVKVFDVYRRSCGSRRQQHHHFQDRKLFYWKKGQEEQSRETEDDIRRVKMSLKYYSYQLMTSLDYFSLLEFSLGKSNLSFDHTCRQSNLSIVF